MKPSEPGREDLEARYKQLEAKIEARDIEIDAMNRQASNLEVENGALKRDRERTIARIRNIQWCFTKGKLPVEGGQFDIGITYALLSKLIRDMDDALLTAEESG